MSYVQQVSSGTEGETRYEEEVVVVVDEKKRKRMISNRESARRSRKRKQQHMQDLIKEMETLRRQNGELVARISGIKQRQAPFDSENNVLVAQKNELTERLNYLNNVVANVDRNVANRAAFATATATAAAAAAAAAQAQNYGGGITLAGATFSYPELNFYEGFGEFSMDVPDPMLGPWQTSCTSQPITASSARMFDF